MQKKIFDACVAAAKERKAKRKVKAKVLWGKTIKIGPLNREIVTLLGLRDKKLNGPLCRIHEKDVSAISHYGGLAYHILSQGEYPLMRLVPENVVWACRGANIDERFHRARYAGKFGKHRLIFGEEKMDRLEIMARDFERNPMLSPSKLSKKEKISMRDKLWTEVHGFATEAA